MNTVIKNGQEFRSFFDNNPSLKTNMKDILFTVSKNTKTKTPFDFFAEPPKNKPNEFKNKNELDENNINSTTTFTTNNNDDANTPKLSNMIRLPGAKAKEDKDDLPLAKKDDNEEWNALFDAFKKSMTYLVFTEPNYLIKNGITSAISGENASQITDKILSQPDKFKSFLEHSNELIVSVAEKVEFAEENRINHARRLEEHVNQMDAMLESKSFGFNPAAREKFVAHYEAALEYQKDKSFSMLPTNPLTLAKPF